MFAATATGRSRFAAAIACGVFIVGSAAALTVVLGLPADTRVDSRRADAARIDAEPLELVALGHEREGDALGVHGTIRNPRSGPERDGVSVVVFLYRADGSFATSTQVPVVPPVLAPGGEASFRIVVPDADDVSRYRVSFRTDHRVVPHVDRRGAFQEASR